jgi:D-xylose transport system ATP-binding protein
MADMTDMLRVSSLTVCYGALTALEDISFTMRSGEVVALAGENGAGKSTLIRAIAGGVAPLSGTVRLGGRPVPPNPMAAARQGIGVVWQDLALLDNMDVASNVMFGNERRRHLLSVIALHKEAGRVLTSLGISLRDTTRPVGSLSGGQRQMVAVARAMAHDPRLLLLDETMASLGVTEAALVEGLIARLRERGTTILLSGHSTELMFRLADRILVLRDGRLVAEVVPSETRLVDVRALISGELADPAGLSARRWASAIEQDRLLDQLTARNRLLETSRRILQALAGAASVADGLPIALQALRRGLAADETALVITSPDGTESVRGYAGAGDTGAGDTGPGDTGPGETIPPDTLTVARTALAGHGADDVSDVARDGRFRFVTFTMPGASGPEGRAVLLAAWANGRCAGEATDLLEDTAHSLRLALGREPALGNHGTQGVSATLRDHAVS